MSKLARLAVKALHMQIKEAENANRTSDDLNDIKLWLDENRDELPAKGEVGQEELFSMVDRLIIQQEKIQSSLNRANEWAIALSEKQGG